MPHKRAHLLSLWSQISIGKTWNACVFEIERPAGEGRDRIRGAQRRGLRPQGAFHLEGARLTCLENGWDYSLPNAN